MTATTTPDPWAQTRKGKPSVGDVAIREYTLTDEHARVWAEISQDFNPLHFDEAAAAKSIFGRRVGHGGLMQAILHGICGTDLPGPGTVFLHLDWRLQSPSTSTRRYRTNRGPRGPGRQADVPAGSLDHPARRRGLPHGHVSHLDLASRLTEPAGVWPTHPEPCGCQTPGGGSARPTWSASRH